MKALAALNEQAFASIESQSRLAQIVQNTMAAMISLFKWNLDATLPLVLETFKLPRLVTFALSQRKHLKLLETCLLVVGNLMFSEDHLSLQAFDILPNLHLDLLSVCQASLQHLRDHRNIQDDPDNA